ncbi:MAG: hypothetical protein N2746_02575 [Deltaproteobacteria bacterium]|nr:hypothetical protein [Deltaproteobacteria bacterium]
MKRRLEQQKGFTYLFILRVFIMAIVVAVLLIPFVVISVVRNCDEPVILFHIIFQLLFLFILLVVLIYLTISPELIVLSSRESIGYLLFEHFKYGLGLRAGETDVPDDHIKALGTLFKDAFPKPIHVLDICGGKGTFAKWLVEEYHSSESLKQYTLNVIMRYFLSK